MGPQVPPQLCVPVPERGHMLEATSTQTPQLYFLPQEGSDGPQGSREVSHDLLPPAGVTVLSPGPQPVRAPVTRRQRLGLLNYRSVPLPTWRPGGRGQGQCGLVCVRVRSGCGCCHLVSLGGVPLTRALSLSLKDPPHDLVTSCRPHLLTQSPWGCCACRGHICPSHLASNQETSGQRPPTPSGRWVSSGRTLPTLPVQQPRLVGTVLEEAAHTARRHPVPPRQDPQGQPLLVHVEEQMARACTLSRPWETAMGVLRLQPASPGPLGVGVWPRLWSAQKLGLGTGVGRGQWRLPTSGAAGPFPSLC